MSLLSDMGTIISTMTVGEVDFQAVNAFRSQAAWFVFGPITAIGAIWSSAAPEFGPQTVIDRFSQIEPKLVFAVNGYRYGGKDFDRREWQAIFRQMMGFDLMRPNAEKFGALEMTGKARPILRGEATITLRRDSLRAVKSSTKIKTLVSEEDAPLMSALKAKRRAQPVGWSQASFLPRGTSARFASASWSPPPRLGPGWVANSSRGSPSSSGS